MLLMHQHVGPCPYSTTRDAQRPASHLQTVPSHSLMASIKALGCGSSRAHCLWPQVPLNKGAGWPRSSPTCWRSMKTAPSSLGALATFRGLTYFILHYSPHTPRTRCAIRTLFLTLTRRPGAAEHSASGLRSRLDLRHQLRPRASKLTGRQRGARAASHSWCMQHSMRSSRAVRHALEQG